MNLPLDQWASDGPRKGAPKGPDRCPPPSSCKVTRQVAPSAQAHTTEFTVKSVDKHYV